MDLAKKSGKLDKCDVAFVYVPPDYHPPRRNCISVVPKYVYRYPPQTEGETKVLMFKKAVKKIKKNNKTGSSPAFSRKLSTKLKLLTTNVTNVKTKESKISKMIKNEPTNFLFFM